MGPSKDGAEGFTEEGLFDYVYEAIASLLKVSAASLDEQKKNMRVTVKLNRGGVPMSFQSEVDVEQVGSNSSGDRWASRDPEERNSESEAELSKTPSAAKKVFDKFTKWMQGEKNRRAPSFSQSIVEAEKVRRESKIALTRESLEELKTGQSNKTPQNVRVTNEKLKGAEDFDDIGTLGRALNDDDDDFDWASLEIVVEEGDSKSSSYDARRSFRRPRRKETGGKRKSNARKSESRKSNAHKSDPRRSDLRKSNRRNVTENGGLITEKNGVVQYKSLNSRMIDSLYKVGKEVEDEKFEFGSNEILSSKREDVLLNQKVLDQPLSRRQAQLVMSTAKVRVQKDPNGKFGAAIKRRLKVKALSKQKKKKKKKRGQVRSPNVAWNMQPHLIMIYFIVPLLLLALNDLIPLIERYLNYINNPDSFEDTKDHQLPYLIRIFIPAQYLDILNKRLKIGAYALRVGGIYLTFTSINRLFKLMNLLRPKPVLKRISTTIDEDEDDTEHNYRFLLKWQGESTTDGSVVE